MVTGEPSDRSKLARPRDNAGKGDESGRDAVARMEDGVKAVAARGEPRNGRVYAARLDGSGKAVVLAGTLCMGEGAV